MSFADKIRNRLDAMRGRTKESAGAATRNRDLRVEGRGERTGADLRDAAEKAKDAFRG